MKTDKLEYRTLDVKIEFAENTVTGYALLFNSPSTGMDFTEIIDSGAITEETVLASDVFAVLDHDRGRGILARSNRGTGSLKLKLDTKGLKYEFVLPQTSIGDELRAHLERGEITQSSFAFTVAKERWESGDNGEYIRHVEAIDAIYDVSPVFNAAYEGTDVHLRKKESEKRMKQEIERLNKLKETEEKEQRMKEEQEARIRNNKRNLQMMKLKLMLS
jgi:HK97 family phage prohead protease